MTWFEERYAGGRRTVEQLAAEQYACPLAAESLAALPPLTGVVGDGEVLRDEGLAYFEAVAAAGTEAEWREFEHAFHAFPLFPFGWPRRDALNFVLQRLRAEPGLLDSAAVRGAATAARAPPARMQLGTGFEFDDGEQLLVSVQKPIGMVLEEHVEEAAAELEGAGCSGCVVAAVVDGSAASRAGIEPGFRLLAVGNMDVRATELDEVMGLLQQSPRVVNLRFVR